MGFGPGTEFYGPQKHGSPLSPAIANQGNRWSCRIWTGNHQFSKLTRFLGVFLNFQAAGMQSWKMTLRGVGWLPFPGSQRVRLEIPVGDLKSAPPNTLPELVAFNCRPT